MITKCNGISSVRKGGRHKIQDKSGFSLYTVRIATLTLCAVLVLMLGCGTNRSHEDLSAALPEVIDFNQHVRPILSDRCYSCHGPDANTREADLRLDTEDGLFTSELETSKYPPVKAGKPGQSALYHRIASDDPEFLMPPPSANLTLEKREKAILEKWIEQGAEWKPHWAFIPPEKPTPPSVKNESWTRNEIDQFTLRAMEAQRLAPAPPADKATLLRRLTMDLTGLPPTVDELDDFIRDTSPDAIEKVVDRLLASPHYGENMAVDWLDLARYADTHGYQADYYRPHWPWRDWVIDAFNSNMPYDTFVTWQLAGDLLPDATREQKLATGFNRNHAQNAEGGIIDEEYRVEYVADRTQTFGIAFLGMTLECARCHDHKFDPISQKEFYEIFSFFNNVSESGQITWNTSDLPGPTMLLPDEEVKAKKATIEKLLAEKEMELDSVKKAEYSTFNSWLNSSDKQSINTQPSQGLLAHFPLENVNKKRIKNKVPGGITGSIIDPLDGSITQSDLKIVESVSGKGLTLSGDEALSFPTLGQFSRSDEYSIGMWVKIPRALESGVIFHSNKGSALYTFKGYQLSVEKDQFDIRLAHDFPYNSIHLLSRDSVPRDQWIHIMLTYDGSSTAEGTRFYLNGELQSLEVHRDRLFKDIIFHGKTPDDPVPIATHLKIGARWRGKGFTNGQVDEIKVFNRALTHLEVNQLAGGKIGSSILQKNTDELSTEERELLFDFYLHRRSSHYRKVLKEVQGLKKEENEIIEFIPHVMVMEEMEKPRPSYLLHRGAYDQKGDEVFPGTPSQIKAFDATFPQNRLGLAQWLFHEENPLPARVAVNRFWQHYFGRGIVETSEDFGSQGALPSHPKLLDWLARSFMESGWDIKYMQKLIVMSATYQQSSVADSLSLVKDPDNVYLSRGPHARLSAENLRDLVLAASGLLHTRIGGPPVRPYQPEGLWDFNRMSGSYQQDTGENLYRRSLYTYWKRTIPPPSMQIFDAPTRAICVVRREETATPLQALVLMNDPQFVEAARVLAERIMKMPKGNARDKITYAIRLLTSQSPSEEQLALLLDQYESAMAYYTENPEKSSALVHVGAHDVDKSLDKVRLAAYATVCTTIINFEGTAKKG